MGDLLLRTGEIDSWKARDRELNEKFFAIFRPTTGPGKLLASGLPVAQFSK
jgi:hypothetical protein